MKKTLFIILIAVLLLAGTGILLTPAICNYLEGLKTDLRLEQYESAVSGMDEHLVLEHWQRAREFNGNMTGSSVQDPFAAGNETLAESYFSVLNMKGVMGYVEIPVINVRVAIYHGTSEGVLQRGAGHLFGTGLPIGGEGNHSVLTGHSGLPTAKFFTDLENIKFGDYFYLKILDETLAYEVDQIIVVEPDDTKELRSVAGEDYVTLITCTPYAVNTHRLLVRGTRVPYTADTTNSSIMLKSPEQNNTFILLIILIILILILFLLIFLWYRMKKNRKRKRVNR